MKLSKFILPVLLLGISLMTKAQNLASNQNELLEYIKSNHLSLRIADEEYKDINGNPYLFDEFFEGKLIVQTGEVFNGEFRLDVYSNVIQFRDEKHIYALNFPAKIKNLDMNGNCIQFIEYQIKDFRKSGYFICLLEDQISLFQKKEKRLMAEQISRAMQQPTEAQFLDKKDIYFLKVGDDPAVKIANKKTLFALFPEHAEKIGEQIKANKIHFNNQNNLIWLVNYLNGIVVGSIVSID